MTEQDAINQSPIVLDKKTQFFVIYDAFTPSLAKRIINIIKYGFPTAKAQLYSSSSNIPKIYIPLIACETLQQLYNNGVHCPNEFIIEQKDFLFCTKSDNKDNIEYEGVEFLLARIELLTKFHPHGIESKEIKDWFAGLFRKYLFLDENVHGTSGVMDLNSIKDRDGKELTVKIDNFIQKWLSNDNIDDNEQKQKKDWFHTRFSSTLEKDEDGSLKKYANDPLIIYHDFIKKIFFTFFKNFSKIISEYQTHYQNANQETKEKYIKEVKQLFSEENTKGNIPKTQGTNIKYLSPLQRFNVLVIDDEAEDEVQYLNNQVKLKDIFHFDAWTLKANKDYPKSAIKDLWQIRNQETAMAHTRTSNNISTSLNLPVSYDLILLDLCLGEQPGHDLSGYYLIKLLHQFFPHTPIVIYSEHDDMGHIRRAFHAGAKWFLKKTEVEKLPRHIYSLLELIDWKKESRTLINDNIFKFHKAPHFKRIFDSHPEWQYLVFKSLETMPGNYISLRPQAGGLSTAVTLQAMKGIILDEKGLQSPVIIKIDNVFNTRMEFERYRRFINPYISNDVGRVEQPERVISRDYSSIVYSFAGHQDSAHRLDTMKSMLLSDILARSSCDYEKYRKALDELFDEILPKIHKITPELEFCDSEYRIFTKTSKLKLSEMSDYPNPDFGEVESRLSLYNDEVKHSIRRFKDETMHDSEFLQNYICRMPYIWEIDDFTILQTSHDQPSEDTKFLTLEVHETTSKGEIECYCINDNFNETNKISGKEKVILSGNTAKYYSRFCPLIFTGMTLNIVPISQSNIKRIGDDFNESSNVEKLRKIFEDNKSSFTCPVGIIHGDLHYGNIMLEIHKHNSIDDNTNQTGTVTDVWLIDFARTRRDLIAHDFNTFFTYILLLLCSAKLNINYFGKLVRIIDNFLENVLFNKNDAIPDIIENDKRFSLIYCILRRVRKAALAAGISESMYLLTTALSCLYTAKYFKDNKKVVKEEKKIDNEQAVYILRKTASLCINRLEKLYPRK